MNNSFKIFLYLVVALFLPFWLFLTAKNGVGENGSSKDTTVLVAAARSTDSAAMLKLVELLGEQLRTKKDSGGKDPQDLTAITHYLTDISAAIRGNKPANSPVLRIPDSFTVTVNSPSKPDTTNSPKSPDISQKTPVATAKKDTLITLQATTNNGETISFIDTTRIRDVFLSIHNSSRYRLQIDKSLGIRPYPDSGLDNILILPSTTMLFKVQRVTYTTPATADSASRIGGTFLSKNRTSFSHAVVVQPGK